jgi:hypothetical protein
MSFISSSSSIYCPPNPYGYRYNVNHPQINELYRRYLVWKGIVKRPPTDEERYEFEKYIDQLIKKSASPPVVQ